MTINQLLNTPATKQRYKYERVVGENANQRWDREHIEKWTEQIEICDDIIEMFDNMDHNTLIEHLEKGDASLQWAHARKAKYEALIVKYTEPDYVASRVGKMAVVKAGE